ncbi:MAG: FAD-dependent oxidoreductase [Pseudolabrys sp.]
MHVLVIGAGVVGLAVARAAALKGHEVIVAEMTKGIGNGVSSRNSEVIHGGMYYPADTLRARHCVRGRRMLYEFCASHGVPRRKCGSSSSPPRTPRWPRWRRSSSKARSTASKASP